MSHYGKFTAFYKLISIVYNWQIKSDKKFPQNHAVPELFLKIALGTRWFTYIHIWYVLKSNFVCVRIVKSLSRNLVGEHFTSYFDEPNYYYNDTNIS